MATKLTTTKRYNWLGEIFIDLSQALRPVERLSVADAAEKYRYVNQPGSYVGQWKNATVPYMVEPMNTVSSRWFDGMIFVGPAQSGKTDSLLINAGVLYSAVVDPIDTMIVCPSQTAARDFSIRRIDRLHRHSTSVGTLLAARADADNKFDKQYRNGMLLTLSWPTPTELAGKPIGRVFLTDRDRMDDDVAGDGEPFDLASKRTTTYGSYAMTVAESSPSRPVLDPKWMRSSPHEAPPCTGILGLYNRGDMRRLYWPCPHCGEHFEGTFDDLRWDREPGMSNFESADTVRMVCPHCACIIHPDERDEMLYWSVWLKDGQTIDADGRIRGEGKRTKIASFWLQGVAAAFVTWRKLVNTYLDAMDSYERTGSEDELVKFYNNDLAQPYIPKDQDNLRVPETIKARAWDTEVGVVPKGVRFLIATIDVQTNRFVVQVFGIMPGSPFDTILIDRFDIKYSNRVNEAGERYWVKPHSYAEDWHLIKEQVIDKTYPIDDGTGRMMPIRQTSCDSGGKRGVTSMAYNFYRWLVNKNAHRYFILVKGDHSPKQPRTRISYPDAQQRDNKAAARGDVPVLLLNSNMLKDNLNGRLDCMQPGQGMYITGKWTPDAVYQELCCEVRTDKGWENKAGDPNEAWDLSYYCIGVAISPLISVERLDWDNPPPWAADWDENSMLLPPETEAMPESASPNAFDTIANLASSLT